ncbi:MAG TPA: hypothetical protein VI409_09645 [Gaiellaceae bacterium]|nr:hypothetical protein [Gaiellaceae bacterium]
MKTHYVVLVALIAAVTLASVAAATPGAVKQRVAIASKLYPERTFVFTPVTAGPLKRDSGTVGFDAGTFTFKGKRGTLTIRELYENWVNCGSEEHKGVIPAVDIGPWKVVRGTGQYKGVTGGGESAQAGLGNPWYARQEGYLASP